MNEAISYVPKHIDIDFVIGAVFILFYAAGRFNTPVTNRSSTTACRYFLALLGYWFAGILIYTLLVQFPHLLVFLMGGDETVMPQWAEKLSRPLMVALTLTVLLPKVPFLSEPENWVRKQLQKMAAIPYEVRRLSAELRKANLKIADDLQTDVRLRLMNAGINAKDIAFEPGRTPIHLWTRLAVLLAKLDDWESDRKMSGYLAAFPGEIEQLRQRFERLMPKAKTCFRLLRENTGDGATARTHEALVRYQEDFMEQLDQLHSSILEFISRGLLHSELTDGARLHRLEKLGFATEWRSARFTFNQVMLVFSVVFLAMVAASVLFAGRSRGLTIGRTITSLVMVAAIYSVAVACAVFRKEDWKAAKYRPGEMRPVGFYILSGLLAVVLSGIISLSYGCFQMHGRLENVWPRFLFTYPWLLSTFATTVTTGFLLDNTRSPRLSRLQQRLLEGLLQGLVMTGVSYLVCVWLRDLGKPPVEYRIPPFDQLQVVVRGGVIGFVLGFCIPTWRREAPRLNPELPAAEPEFRVVTAEDIKPAGSG